MQGMFISVSRERARARDELKKFASNMCVHAKKEEDRFEFKNKIKMSRIHESERGEC